MSLKSSKDKTSELPQGMITQSIVNTQVQYNMKQVTPLLGPKYPVYTHYNSSDIKATEPKQMQMKVQSNVHSEPCPSPLTSPPFKDKYEPKDIYHDVETGIYCIDCDTHHKRACVNEVVVGLKRGTTFMAHIGKSMCHVLVDTGASCLCMSESYYKLVTTLANSCGNIHKISHWK